MEESGKTDDENATPDSSTELETLEAPQPETPKFVPGYLALCSHCGYLSEEFTKCMRCKRRLPDDVKSISNPNKYLTDKKALERKMSSLQKTVTIGTSSNSKSRFLN